MISKFNKLYSGLLAQPESTLKPKLELRYTRWIWETLIIWIDIPFTLSRQIKMSFFMDLKEICNVIYKIECAPIYSLL